MSGPPSYAGQANSPSTKSLPRHGPKPSDYTSVPPLPGLMGCHTNDWYRRTPFPCNYLAAQFHTRGPHPVDHDSTLGETQQDGCNFFGRSCTARHGRVFIPVGGHILSENSVPLTELPDLGCAGGSPSPTRRHRFSWQRVRSQLLRSTFLADELQQFYGRRRRSRP